MKMSDFTIREYGRAELAAAYCPGVCADAAWRKLKRWIDLSPGLADRLRQTGYNGNNRSFTPAQVRLIVAAIGEP